MIPIVESGWSKQGSLSRQESDPQSSMDRFWSSTKDFPQECCKTWLWNVIIWSITCEIWGSPSDRWLKIWHWIQEGNSLKNDRNQMFHGVCSTFLEYNFKEAPAKNVEHSRLYKPETPGKREKGLSDVPEKNRDCLCTSNNTGGVAEIFQNIMHCTHSGKEQICWNLYEIMVTIWEFMTCLSMVSPFPASLRSRKATRARFCGAEKFSEHFCRAGLTLVGSGVNRLTSKAAVTQGKSKR